MSPAERREAAGTGECACGHALVWHSPQDHRNRPCELCECRAYERPTRYGTPAR